MASRTMSPGTVMCGGVVSRTVTANEDEPVFPWASLAVQSTRVVPSVNMNPEDGLQVAVTGPSTMSVAPTENGTVAPPGPVASEMMSAGTVSAGGVVSMTRTVKDATPVLPWASVATHVTVVVPNPNVEPEAGVQTGVSLPSTRSSAVTTKIPRAPVEPVASRLMPVGDVIVGGVVSTTMTSKDLDAKLPWESFAVHITVVAPSGNMELEVGVHWAATGPSTRSDADAENPTVAPRGPVASAVIVPGSTRVGGVVSWTVTWNEPVAVLPWASVAVQRTATVPRGNVDPEARLHDTGTGPSTRSVAEGAKETAAPDGPVASAIVSAGSVNTGGVVS